MIDENTRVERCLIWLREEHEQKQEGRKHTARSLKGEYIVDDPKVGEQTVHGNERLSKASSGGYGTPLHCS